MRRGGGSRGNFTPELHMCNRDRQRLHAKRRQWLCKKRGMGLEGTCLVGQIPPRGYLIKKTYPPWRDLMIKEIPHPLPDGSQVMPASESPANHTIYCDKNFWLKKSQRETDFLCRLTHILEFPECRFPRPHPHAAVRIDQHRTGTEHLNPLHNPGLDLRHGFNGFR